VKFIAGLVTPPGGGVKARADRAKGDPARAQLVYKGEFIPPLLPPGKVGEWVVPSPAAQSLSWKGGCS